MSPRQPPPVVVTTVGSTVHWNSATPWRVVGHRLDGSAFLPGIAEHEAIRPFLVIHQAVRGR